MRRTSPQHLHSPAGAWVIAFAMVLLVFPSISPTVPAPGDPAIDPFAPLERTVPIGPSPVPMLPGLPSYDAAR